MKLESAFCKFVTEPITLIARIMTLSLALAKGGGSSTMSDRKRSHF